MSILYISASNGNHSHLSDITFPTVERFCVKNGYSFRRYHIPKEYDRPASWFKILTFIDLLGRSHENKEFEYFGWIDSDAAIINNDFNLENILENKFDFFISKDFNNFNCGSFIIKNCYENLILLKEIYQKTEYLNHIWWEQAAFIELYESNFRDLQSRTKIVDQSILNAYDYRFYGKSLDFLGSVNQESFIIHCPSLPLKTREDVLLSYIKQDE